MSAGLPAYASHESALVDWTDNRQRASGGHGGRTRTAHTRTHESSPGDRFDALRHCDPLQTAAHAEEAITPVVNRGRQVAPGHFGAPGQSKRSGTRRRSAGIAAATAVDNSNGTTAADSHIVREGISRVATGRARRCVSAHPLKQALPIDVTDSGTLRLTRFVQQLKTAGPSDSRPSGRTTVVSEPHVANALSPMERRADTLGQ